MIGYIEWAKKAMEETTLAIIKSGQEKYEQTGIVSSFAFELGYKACRKEHDKGQTITEALKHFCMHTDEQTGVISSHAYSLGWEWAIKTIEEEKSIPKLDEVATKTSSSPMFSFSKTCKSCGHYIPNAFNVQFCPNCASSLP